MDMSIRDDELECFNRVGQKIGSDQHRIQSDTPPQLAGAERYRTTISS